jgi:predicted nucleic acid-binding protein
LAVLIDTDVMIGIERGGAGPDAIADDEERAISVITVSELLHGVHRARGAVRARRLSFVEHLLEAIPAVPITTPVARVHAEIHAGLAARGDAVGAHDLWIAATALAHGLGLATGNVADFERIPGLRLIEA